MSSRRSASLIGLLAGCAFVGALGWFFVGDGAGGSHPTRADTRPPDTSAEPPGNRDPSAQPSRVPLDGGVFDKQFAHSLENSMDYEDLRRRLEPLASQNDAVALRMLGEVYEYCAGFSLTPASAGEGIDALAKVRPENTARLKEIGDRVESRCKGLRGGVPIPVEEAELYWSLAASARDPAALARMAARTSNLPQGVIDFVASAAFDSGDARALFELGEAIHRHGGPESYPDLAGGALDAYALQIVSCRRSPAMCAPSSPLMESRCLHAGACNFSSFEDMIRRGAVGQASQIDLDRRISAVNGIIDRRGR